jgi:hypothetical protein
MRDFPGTAAATFVYLARRRAGLDDEEFAQRWRAHSALAARYPELMRCVRAYSQARVLGVIGAPSGLEGPWDAIGLTTCHDRAALETMLASTPTVEILHPDELRVFDSPCERYCLRTREVLRSALSPPSPGELRVARFVRRHSGLSEEGFAQRWPQQLLAWLGDRQAHSVDIDLAIEPSDFGFDGLARFTLVHPDELSALAAAEEAAEAARTLTLAIREQRLLEAAAG